MLSPRRGLLGEDLTSAAGSPARLVPDQRNSNNMLWPGPTAIQPVDFECGDECSIPENTLFRSGRPFYVQTTMTHATTFGIQRSHVERFRGSGANARANLRRFVRDPRHFKYAGRFSCKCAVDSEQIQLRMAAEAGLLDIRIQPPNFEEEALAIPAYLKKECVLFYYPSCEPLAKRIAETSNGTVELGNIKWGHFADGFPNLFVQDAIRIRNRHVAFLACFQNPGTIFEQLSVIYQLPRMFVGSFTLVLPYFPTGTAERDMGNRLALRGHPCNAWQCIVVQVAVALCRPQHFWAQVEAEGDVATAVTLTGIPLLRKRLAELPDNSNITIAYPDEGAWKRFHYQFGDYPEVICTKVRDGDKRIVRLKEGEPKGRHVVIIDDLVQSGGTLIECQKLLKTQGAVAVSGYVTHGVFPNEAYKRFVQNNGTQDEFKFFWVTDSCPDTCKAVEGQKPFEIISLAGPITATLQV
eukprot:jgi/Botrbrau1/9059/Bobra.0376s0033.1